MGPLRRDFQIIPGGRAADASSSAAAAPARRMKGRGDDRTAGGEAGTELMRELYGKYGGTVYGRCCYLLRDRAKAEDAMQDVFAKALTNLAGFRSEASPVTWLIKIATNHCLNLLRSERAAWRQVFEREETARLGGDAGAAAGPQLFEDREAVRKLLAKVDVETQAAAIHYYVDEMTLEEVAAALGRSVPTVRKRLETFAALSGAELSS